MGSGVENAMRKLPVEVHFGLRGNRENHKEPIPVQLYHKIKSREKPVVYIYFSPYVLPAA
jgi:hypothetical protein